MELSLLSTAAVQQDTSPHNQGNTDPNQSISVSTEVAVEKSVSSSSEIVIDFVSIGSVTQTDLQQAQSETFGTGVRHFYAATEADDVEQDCHKRLTWHQVRQVISHCHYKLQSHPLLMKLGTLYIYLRIFKVKKNPSGWICAQKRPLNALQNAVRKYYFHNNETKSNQGRIQQLQQDSSDLSSLLRLDVSLLPDYLIIGDDDTWINIDALKSSLPKMYPPNEPRAVAGCLIRFEPRYDYFTIPFGGFGLVLTRSTLFNLLRPIDCSFQDTKHTERPVESRPPFSKDSDFDALVCWRLEQNLIGEREVFRRGMSLLDMMYEYSVAAPYLQVEQWGNRSFCLHSDWVWGYLINYYHMARHSSHGNPPKLPGIYKTVGSVLHNRMEGYNHSQHLTKNRHAARYLGQCRNSNDYNRMLMRSSSKPSLNVPGQNKSSPGDAYCDKHAHFCHRISASHMHNLHQLHQQM